MQFDVSNPILLKMLEKKLILTIDEVSDTDLYYSKKRENIVEMNPGNGDLSDPLLDDDDDDFQISEIVNVTYKRTYHVDTSFKSSSIHHHERIKIMQEIIQEYKEECENDERPTYNSLLLYFILDLFALGYGIFIFAVQFIEF
jgi:hypothetical protein